MSVLGITPLTAQSKPLSPANNANGYLPGRSFFEYNGKTIYFNLDNTTDYLFAYNNSPTVKAAINRRAQYFVNGKYQILNENTDTPMRGLEGKRIQKVLDKPNFLQTGKQFKAQLNIYCDTFAYCPVIKFSLSGLGVYAMYNIPPWMFKAELKPNVKWWELPDNATNKDIYSGFFIEWDGVKHPIDMDAVFIVLDNSICGKKIGNLFLPDPRMKGCELPISNEMSSRLAANTLTAKKGAMGILTMNPGGGQYVPVANPKEKQILQDEYSRYGLTGQEWQVIITESAYNWQQMGSPIKDMDLPGVISDAQQCIYDNIGIYSYIMSGGSNGKGTTFSNLEEAKKSQYQDFIIPDDDARTEQVSAGIIPNEDRPYVTVDYSHVEVLQQSEKAKAETQAAQAEADQLDFDLGICTRNDILKARGLPPVDKPEMNKYSWEMAPVVDPNAPEPAPPKLKKPLQV